MKKRAATRQSHGWLKGKLLVLGVVAMSVSAPVLAKPHRHSHAHHHARSIAAESSGNAAAGTYRQTGQASWYGRQFHGRRTANGEAFDRHGFTGAHRSLPFGTTVRVTNLRNGKSILVRINDRGPYKYGRVIDLSYAAAKQLGMTGRGVARVKIEQVPTALAKTEPLKKAGG